MPERKTKVVEQTVECYRCIHCKKDYDSLYLAEQCEAGDKLAIEESNKIKEKRRIAYERKVEKVLDQMPKIETEEYERLAIQLAIGYCPPIIPCLSCGHPHLDGFECPNLNCNGSDDADGIDESDLFYDEQFSLPDDGWKIVYD